MTAWNGGAQMRPRWGRVAGLGLWLVGALAQGAHAQTMEEDVNRMAGMGPPPGRAFLSPDGSFAGKVPSTWAAQSFPHSKLVQFAIPGPGAAWMQVQRLQVSGDARPKQLLMRAREQRLRKLPHFQQTDEHELIIHGLRAAGLSGQFWYQGNAEYPRAVEELFLVAGDEAFEIHFECFAPMVSSLRADLTAFYGSFVPHPAANTEAPGEAGGKEDGLMELMGRVPF